jgi:DNA-binding GntR family transcriptional regulator
MSQSIELFEQIRDDIIAGNLAPGTRLPQQKIATRYEVSKVVTVAAFARLESVGLVENGIGEGVRVRTIDREMLEDEYLIREAIEVQAIREACQNASQREIAELRRMSEKMESAGEQQAICIDQEFHLKIAKMSRSQRIVQALNQLQLVLMFVGQVTTANPNWPYSHARLVDLIEKGDPDSAEAEMRYHIQTARKNGIQAFMESRSA